MAREARRGLERPEDRRGVRGASGDRRDRSSTVGIRQWTGAAARRQGRSVVQAARPEGQASPEDEAPARGPAPCRPDARAAAGAERNPECGEALVSPLSLDRCARPACASDLPLALASRASADLGFCRGITLIQHPLANTSRPTPQVSGVDVSYLCAHAKEPRAGSSATAERSRDAGCTGWPTQALALPFAALRLLTRSPRQARAPGEGRVPRRFLGAFRAQQSPTRFRP